MSIPKNISRVHIDKAIENIVLENIPKERLSYNYFLLANAKKYPPKYVITEANNYTDNPHLDSNEFNAVDAAAFLKKLNYHVQKKDELVNIKLYDIHGKSTIENYRTLLTPDNKFFYWDSKRFTKNHLGDVVFWVNRTEKCILHTLIDSKEVIPEFKNGRNLINDKGYNVFATAQDAKQFENFYRFKIINKTPLPEGWNYSNPSPFNGQTMAIILFDTKIKEPLKKIEKIDDLLHVFENIEEPYELLTKALDALKDIKPKIRKETKEVKKTQNEMINFPLNTILYGPPGTGKTYNTFNYSLNALGVALDGLTRDEIVSIYRDKIDAGEIVFTTFHQSISYEDFIEGIKPMTKDGNVSYKLEDGIFKELCSSKSYFIINDLFGSRNQYKIVALSNTILRIGRDSGVVDISMAFINEMLQLFFSGEISIEDFKTENRDVLRDKFNTKWDKYLFGYDSMYKGILEYVKDKNQEQDSHKKVIIIDEINRGNISNIFGELITLIEEDKRIGSQNYTPVKLPYSKDLFGVPNNLFIIGTMNTADRSVEALDTALRRRFSFIEMNPEPAKLNSYEFKCTGIDLEDLLNSINTRIEKLLDKDYCIGHSYFMTIKDRQAPIEEIKIIFQNKILPLLQEYFYGDWGKILLVIGEKFVETKKNPIKFLSTDSYEDFEEYDEKPIYYFTKPSSWTLDSFKSIYE